MGKDPPTVTTSIVLMSLQYIPTCLMSIYPHVQMSTCHMSLDPYVHMSTCPHVNMSTCPYVHMSICPYVQVVMWTYGHLDIWIQGHVDVMHRIWLYTQQCMEYNIINVYITRGWKTFTENVNNIHICRKKHGEIAGLFRRFFPLLLLATAHMAQPPRLTVSKTVWS
jgi:hypothetical protein